MENVYQRFRDQVEFFIVYIQEAHPTDGRQTDKNIDEVILYRQHRSFEERAEVAQSCSLALDLTIPVLVEEMSDSTDDAYGAAPERLYFIARDGTVAYRGGVGPHFFDINEWQAAIQMYLRQKAA